MRRRLGRFLPIVLVAVLVQILAPIASCWAANTAAADPLHGVVICSHLLNADQRQGGQTNQAPAQHDCCIYCAAAHAATPTGDPQAAAVTIERIAETVVWHPSANTLTHDRFAASAQARGPPTVS
jgi:hypothetical protein